MGEAHPASARFVPPERDAAPVFQFGEQVLDMVVPGVDRPVPRRGIDHAELGRGVDGAAVGCKRGAQPGRHVAAVKGCVTRRDAGHEGRCVAQV